jgi:putative membrane protein
MTKRFLAAGLTVAFAFLMAAAAVAQTGYKAATAENTRDASSNAKSMKASSGKVPASDASFLKKAAQGGLAEVEMGKLAQDKASDADVKASGKRMVDDHGKANDELKSLAEQKGVAVPADLDAKDKAELDRLSKLSGPEFDRAYMKDMVSDHKKDVAEFQKESKAAKDPDVKSWAGKTLPTLEDHLKMAQDDWAKVGGAKTASSTKKTARM